MILNKKNYLTTKEVQQLLNVSPKVIQRISNNDNWDKYVSERRYYFLKDDVLNYIKKLANLKINYISSTDAISYLGTTSSSFSRLVQKMNLAFIEEKTIKYYKIEDIKAYKDMLNSFNSKEFLTIHEIVDYIDLSIPQIRRLIKKFNIKAYYFQGKPKYKKDELDDCIQKFLELKDLKEQSHNKKEERKKRINKEKKMKEAILITHIRYKDAIKLLNLNETIFNNLIEEMVSPDMLKSIGKYNFINKTFVENLSIMQLSFWQNNYTGSLTRSKLPKKLFELLEKIPVPLYAKIKNLKGDCNLYAYAKKEVDLKEKLFNNPESFGYISSDKAKKILDLSRKIFLDVEREYNLSSFCISDNTKYYLKKDIDFLKRQQEDLGKTYLTTTMAYNEYSNLRFLGRSIRGFKLPTFCKTSQIDPKEFCYSREDIETYIRNASIKNVFGKSDFDTFMNRFNLFSQEIPEINYSLYTKNKWLDFIETKLSNSENSSSKSRYNLVKALLNCTINLNSLLSYNKVKEVYFLTTNQINFWFRSVSNEKNRILIYEFFQLVYMDIRVKINTKNKCFKLKDLIKPDDKIFNSTKRQLNIDSESIYTYEEYITLFQHLINIPLHVKSSLKNIETSSNISYLSCWLYLLIHLNNGWRHGDVTHFPRLYLLDILEDWGIYNLNWFRSNQISIPQSQRIIARIIQYNFRISKTEVYGHFFCSDKLAPSIATAILMLECYYKYYFVGEAPGFDEPIMKFQLTKFNEPKPSIISSCIKGCELKDFKFTTRKMNRTVLTFIYNVASEISPSGYNALILPKSLRAHIDEMSTIEYIQFNSNQLEFLSGELFARGEFGFITDSLLNLISNKPDKSIVRTTQIKCVLDLFGDNKKIESTVRMLNEFRDEKIEILNILNEKGYDECVDIISNIYLGNMPSKTSDIQCLFSRDGCKCPNIDCIDCKYKIPSIYILRTICILLKEEIDVYTTTRHIGKKIKLSSKIHNHVDILLEAINKYGQEYVYNCLDIDRVTFLQMFDSIDSVEELIKIKG